MLQARLYASARGIAHPSFQFSVRGVHAECMEGVAVDANMKYRYRIPVWLSATPSKGGIQVGCIVIHVFKTYFELVSFIKNSQRIQAYRVLEESVLKPRGIHSKHLMTSILVDFVNQHLVATFGALPMRVAAESSHLHHKTPHKLIQAFHTMGFRSAPGRNNHHHNNHTTTTTTAYLSLPSSDKLIHPHTFQCNFKQYHTYLREDESEGRNSNSNNDNADNNEDNSDEKREGQSFPVCCIAQL